MVYPLMFSDEKLFKELTYLPTPINQELCMAGIAM